MSGQTAQLSQFSKTAPRSGQPTVAILAMPESSASVVFGMYDLFMGAGRDWDMIAEGRPGASVMQPIIVARQSGTFEVVNGVQVHVHRSLDECQRPDIVCVPEINMPPQMFSGETFQAEIAWLKRCYEQGAVIAAACSGAMLLAEAGLLDGYEATTHWAYCDVMERRYKAVKVHAQRALVVTGDAQRLLLAGGGTSWLDLALYLIARVSNVETAMQVAKMNLIDWHAIGQQPFARLARTRQVDDAIIGRCQEWIASHYHETAPVQSMVRLSGLAERSFKRRFEQSTGMSPLEYVHTLRLEEAKHLLETGDHSIESVAGEVGYEDAGFFGRLFRRKVNMTPALYRKRFQSMRKELQGASSSQSLSRE
ncbi:MAG TPA: helix-turn-helix domain-containing protein [Steroidobacteraceae bacterium]|nr:helix-turn-helix domain-containing protein [Steroidobacteraceae bacterium]